MPALHHWRGRALGAEAHLWLHDPDRDRAESLRCRCVTEIRRLEAIFSLQRVDSALSRLNRDGALPDAPPELAELLAESRRYGELSGGAFDVTVQSLWDLYLTHFARPDADPKGPPADRLARALSKVGYAGVCVTPGGVCLARAGMAVTLNGIAQGYITDRVADLLRDAGLYHVLVDLGEFRALGPHPVGRPWRLGLADPRSPTGTFGTVSLEGGALATSGGYGMRFDAAGHHHHLFDPRTGRSRNAYRSVSVRAPRATVADALSTALAVAAPGESRAILDAMGPATAVLHHADGRVETRRAG